MRKISKVFNDIRVAEMADLTTNLLNEIEKAPADDAHMLKLKEQIQPLNNQLLAAINKDKAASDLDSFDAARDGVYRSLLYLAKGYLHHPDAQIREAAIEVDTVIDKYGFDLVNEAYGAQSALTESFLEDMAKPEVATKVELLPGLKDLTSQLDGEQTKFKTAEEAWNNARSAGQLTENASSVKRELLKVVNERLVVYLRAMIQVAPELYTNLCSKSALLIDSANSIIRRRRHNADDLQITNN
ncbi:hypothetical protein J1N10_05320 [Carboxylicivirga sp. A043]|uniref:DUF6261 family protein n=1 Tax=Carboxylicivirga litoralis TaxID=2816963 RepID=UPI0021CB6E54|nr:DUF6261 family protein [Carboxylicivirga sp. A043]MCU4155385.1 hypothetical protein [Carboxylicivirga sp. A043]